MSEKECKSCSKEPKNTINIMRFINNLDLFFKSNDLDSARQYLEFWHHEAVSLGDKSGLLSIVNEQIGFYRRTGEKEKALKAVDDALMLIEELKLNDNPSAATIFVNLATTLKAFDKAGDGIKYYLIADEIYKKNSMENTYEYCAFLNNKGLALRDLSNYIQAEECYTRAINNLIKDGCHDGEIAVSYVNMAHLYYDMKQNAEKINYCLDKAWEYINSPKQPHDGNYAFILSKCAPSFEYFGRKDEAEALSEVAKEIYERA